VIIISENEYLLAIDQKLAYYKDSLLVNEITLENTITCMAFAGNDVLIGTLGSGLHAYNLTETKLKTLEKDKFINDLVNVGDHSYVLTDDELIKLNSDFEIIKRQQLNFSLPEQIINYNSGKLAILSNNGNIYFLDKSLKQENTYQAQDFYPKDISGYNGALFAIDDQYLKMWNNTEFIDLKTGNFEHVLQVKTSLFISHNRSLNALNVLSQTFNADKTFSIYADDDQFWLGREGKISVFQNNNIEREIIFPEPYKNTYVSSLLVHNETIYAGTMGMGILTFNSKTGKQTGQFPDETIEVNEQNAVKLDLKDDLLWVGYLNGLKAYDIDNKELNYDFSELLDNNYLYAFHVRNSDDFFLGTSDAGLIHVVEGKPTYYLEGSSVYAIIETDSGLVFSVEGKGVYLLNGQKLERLSDDYYLRSEDVYNMLYVEGNIVLANNYGLDILDLKQNSINYITDENLNEAQLNAGASNNSKTLIGYNNQILLLNNNLLNDVHQNELTLQTPLLFDAPVTTNNRNFTYKDNVWTFLYETKNYTSPAEVYYKYRLNPLETEWKNTNQEKITYYNLPPGDYTFELSSGGQRNFIPRQIETFDFSISKPFWMRIWFWVVIVVLINFIIYAIVKYREKQFRKKEELNTIQLQYEYQKLKDQINPHFLFNSFNSLIGIVENNPSQATQVLEKLSSLFRKILEYEKTEIISLSEELELMHQYFEIHKIRFQDLILLKVSDLKNTHRKYVIPFSLQFLIENAIKHNVINSQSKLEINVIEEKGYIVVSNTLNSKQQSKHSLGLGLENLIKRHDMILKKTPIIEKSQGEYIVKIPYIYD
jgi:hypothetical protein